MLTEIVLTDAPIIIPPVLPSSSEIGAVVDFQGLVRESEGKERIKGLVYEAYERMARHQLEVHLHELHALHSCDSVSFIHRLGFVPVGAASVWIRVMAKHRGPAMALCSELLERLKADVPIWKCAAPLTGKSYSQ